jgi:hypothetical protein
MYVRVVRVRCSSAKENNEWKFPERQEIDSKDDRVRGEESDKKFDLRRSFVNESRKQLGFQRKGTKIPSEKVFCVEEVSREFSLCRSPIVGQQQKQPEIIQDKTMEERNNKRLTSVKSKE